MDRCAVLAIFSLLAVPSHGLGTLPDVENVEFGVEFGSSTAVNARVLLKCFYHYQDQHLRTFQAGPSLIWSEPPHSQFVWAQYDGKVVNLFGSFKPGATGLFEATGWQLEQQELLGLLDSTEHPMNLPLTSDNLARVCQGYLDTNPDWVTGRVFVAARTGCPNARKRKSPGDLFSDQGWPTYQCKNFPTPGGPFISVTGETNHPFVVYGDSLSDVGARMWFDIPGYFPASPYYLGRFSNGYVWPEHLALALRGQSTYQIGWHSAAVTGVANYAIGGAVVDAGGVIGANAGKVLEQISWNPLNLGNDFSWLSTWIATSSQLVLTGDLWKELASTDAWTQQVNPYTASLDWSPQANAPPVIVWIGANDLFIAGGLPNANDFWADIGEFGYSTVLGASIASMRKFLEALYDRGHRKMVVGNIPDLGTVPDRLADWDKTDKWELSERWTRAVDFWNVKLAEMLSAFEDSKAGAVVALFDGNRALKDVVAGRLDTPDGYIDYEYRGLARNRVWTMSGPNGQSKHILQACLSTPMGVGWFDVFNTVCRDQSRSIMWDGAHPSTRMQCWFAYGIQLAASRRGVLPTPLLQLYDHLCNEVQAWNGKAEETFWEVPQERDLFGKAIPSYP